jgi:hypothetical protein
MQEKSRHEKAVKQIWRTAISIPGIAVRPDRCVYEMGFSL